MPANKCLEKRQSIINQHLPLLPLVHSLRILELLSYIVKAVSCAVGNILTRSIDCRNKSSSLVVVCENKEISCYNKSLTFPDQNFIHPGTIFPAAGIFNSGPNFEKKTLEKKTLKKSFPTAPNMKGLAFVIIEIIGFEVRSCENRKKLKIFNFWDRKEVESFLIITPACRDKDLWWCPNTKRLSDMCGSPRSFFSFQSLFKSCKTAEK